MFHLLTIFARLWQSIFAAAILLIHFYNIFLS